MATLSRDLRRELERAVIQARRVAEEGARKALAQLAVDHHEPWGSLKPDQRALRNRLRAHGRQLGDRLDERRGTQEIGRLAQECAYEHWHRMLFARFLAECDLLMEPETGVAISLDECRELARERSADWLALASDFAVGMLPQIFRQGDPVLEVAVPPETRHDLEELLKSIQREVFTADDSLGWVYQFWQADRKDEVNASGEKIGADELPAVTQLFTEDYMVDFLLDNTLGAWWAGKVFTANPKLAETAKSEEELRKAVALAGVPWTYLRFIKGQDGKWRPAAGTFEGWPKTAKELKCLDPCMGSGHFVVAMFERLVASRMAEEKLSEKTAVEAVIRDNLFGLEIDPRCTQIGAFNLALAAWRRVGYCALPTMHLACSGLGVVAKRDEWLALAQKSDKLRGGMEQLYQLFQKAPVLGSLINPRAVGEDLFVAAFHELQPLLGEALAQETKDDTAHEMAVTARGLAKAAEILAGQFTLVVTNVPYLGYKKQDDVLKSFCETHHPEAKPDLATCFVERGLNMCFDGCTAALVTPQNWLFLGAYEELRQKLLSLRAWHMVARLGSGAFETITGEVVNVALIVMSKYHPAGDNSFAGLDATEDRDTRSKAITLYSGSMTLPLQASQLKNVDTRIIIEKEGEGAPPLSQFCTALAGATAGDSTRFGKVFWEVNSKTIGTDWEFYLGAPQANCFYESREMVILWEKERGQMRDLADSVKHLNHVAQNWRRGKPNWGKQGIAVSVVCDIPATIYTGEIYDCSCCALVPNRPEHLSALWAFVESGKYAREVRKLDQKIIVTTATLLKVPFDLAHWQKVAAEKYPPGLPKPFSSDPTQWLFNGHPKGSDNPLQVAVARLLDYRWPRQTGSSFPDCPALGPDGLERHTDADGIVCLSSIKGESAAADRLRALLADAFGNEWSATKQAELLSQVGYAGNSLEEWLRDAFFEQHCELFHQRPFIWHIWDGLKNGFHALVNYHKLAGPKGEARRTLEKLIYTYLGDWTDRQRADQKAGVEGADLRVAAAQHLKAELEKILEGEQPYDIFVRWKPLDKQPIGWEPDINDGVRMNIRPFMTARPLSAKGKNACILRVTPKIKWEKDRGKEPHRPKEDFPWFWSWDESTQDFAGGKEFDGNRWNDLHYTRKSKQSAGECHAARQKEQGK